VPDIEDSMPADAKALDRDLLANTWREPSPGQARLVRVNELEGPLAVDDLTLVGRPGTQRARRSAGLDPDDRRGGSGGAAGRRRVESARGLREAYELASRPLSHAEDAYELLNARGKVVADGVPAGVSGLFDRVFADADPAGAAADAALGRSLGFRGKSTPRPEHVAAINAAFTNAQISRVARPMPRRGIEDPLPPTRPSGRGPDARQLLLGRL